MEEKEMTLEEMQQECMRVSYEIAKMQSIHKKLVNKFDDLNYKIWKIQKEKENAKSDESQASKKDS